MRKFSGDFSSFFHNVTEKNDFWEYFLKACESLKCDDAKALFKYRRKSEDFWQKKVKLFVTDFGVTAAANVFPFHFKMAYNVRYFHCQIMMTGIHAIKVAFNPR